MSAVRSFCLDILLRLDMTRGLVLVEVCSYSSAGVMDAAGVYVEVCEPRVALQGLCDACSA